jgi:hypothetical protein
MNLPQDIANQALDAIGYPFTIGDLEEGTKPAQIALRAYRQNLMQLLRAANWDFARKQAPLQLLADSTGNTPDVGTLVPEPWIYEYAYPTDCMKVRFVPWNWQNQASSVPANNIQISTTTPIVGGIGNQQPGARQVPARFVVATDFNYPPAPGQITWEVQGVSPQGRTVVLTNVRNAVVVYTALMLYPSTWDPQFRAAFVAYLAAEIALPIWAEKDRNFGLKVRDEQVSIVKEKVTAARLTDGNEGTYSSDIKVDWMETRYSGGPWGAGGWGVAGPGGLGWPGVLGYGYDSLAIPGGSAF